MKTEKTDLDLLIDGNWRARNIIDGKPSHISAIGESDTSDIYYAFVLEYGTMECLVFPARFEHDCEDHVLNLMGFPMRFKVTSFESGTAVLDGLDSIVEEINKLFSGKGNIDRLWIRSVANSKPIVRSYPRIQPVGSGLNGLLHLKERMDESQWEVMDEGWRKPVEFIGELEDGRLIIGLVGLPKPGIGPESVIICMTGFGMDNKIFGPREIIKGRTMAYTIRAYNMKHAETVQIKRFITRNGFMIDVKSETVKF